MGAFLFAEGGLVVAVGAVGAVGVGDAVVGDVVAEDVVSDRLALLSASSDRVGANDH
jgi:hypothetical protein